MAYLVSISLIKKAEENWIAKFTTLNLQPFVDDLPIPDVISCLFDNVVQVQKFATEWLWTYNHASPNMALGGMTPKQKLALAV